MSNPEKEARTRVNILRGDARSCEDTARDNRFQGFLLTAIGVSAGVLGAYSAARHGVENAPIIETMGSGLTSAILIAGGARYFSQASHESRMSAVFKSAQLDLENALALGALATVQETTPLPAGPPITAENTIG